jgi:cysteine desulfurase
MLPYLSDKYGNPSSLHHKGQEAREGIENARAIIAKKINAQPEEIIFTSGGTESNNLAIKGVAKANKKKGNHIITSAIEHHCVLNSCKSLEKEGFKVTYLPVTSDGFVDVDELKAAITEKTILVSIMHVNNEIGTIQLIKEIGEICKEKKIIFHTDAVQSFTKIPIDAKSLNVDLISFSAHKIHGPKGVGAIYIKKGTIIQPILHGGSQEKGLRAGTENVPGIVCFGKAVEIADPVYLQFMENFRDILIDEALKIPFVQLNGSRENRICNNANLAFNYIEGESLLLYLDSRGFCVSTASACASHSLEPSHVLTAIGLSPEIAHGSIRFSLSKYTSKDDIETCIKKLKESVEELRKISSMVR